MATRRVAAGIAHPTVVPENFDPEEDSGDGSDETGDEPPTRGDEGRREQ